MCYNKSGFAGSLLGGIVKGLNNISTYTKTILMSIAGGTASVLGGGKFANGAMSSAFIFMFNEMAQAVARQAYIIKRATIVAKRLYQYGFSEYGDKILSLIKEGKLLYVENAWRHTAKGLEYVFGTADIKNGVVRLTSRIWTDNMKYGIATINQQIGITLVHEVKHLILGTASHPGGRSHFTDEFNSIRFY